MSLYEEWLAKAYDSKNGTAIAAVWDVFIPKEQKIYEYILNDKVTNISGTISELGQRFVLTDQDTCGFVDGINEILPAPYIMNDLEPESYVSLDIDFGKLYKKMVECGAEHLYNLPEWDNIFTKDERERLYHEQKTSTIFTRDTAKIGRNVSCPCGSGKKYKKCCGR